MRLPAQDQLLAPVLYGVGGDRTAAVPAGLVPEAGFIRQRIHQPGLALGNLPDATARCLPELLAGLRRMLHQQGLDLGLREVAQPVRLGLDVERAAIGDNRVLGAGSDPVVAHIAYSAKDHALRKAVRPFRVAGADLSEHR